jgi:membrane protease YdiL (CAAX protease family)
MKIINKSSWLYRVLVIALFFIAIQVPPVAVQLANHYSANEVIVSAFVALFLGLMLAIIWLASHTYQQYNQLGKPAGIKLRWIIGGFLVIILGTDILSVLNKVIYHQTETANNAALGNLLGHNQLVTIAFMFSAIVLSPIAEEFIFRGSLTNMFFKVTNIWPKVVLSGLVFSAGHMSTNPVSFLIYAFMGMTLAYVYLQTRDIRNSMAIHMLNNLIAMFVLFTQIS